MLIDSLIVPVQYTNEDLKMLSHRLFFGKQPQNWDATQILHETNKHLSEKYL